MKKLILLFSAGLLSLTSCSSDDNGGSPSTSLNVKPTKIVSTFSGSTQISTSTYTYNGNKIVEELIVPSTDVSKIKYTYTGDNITKIEEFSGPTFDLYNTITYTYENNKIKTEVEQGTAAFPYGKENYVHNADGTVSSTHINIDQSTGVETSNSEILKSYFLNGNLIKTEVIDATGAIGRTYNLAYETGKFHAFKNVTGFDKIALAGNNNLTSITFSGMPSSIVTYTSTYNSSNYPIQIVSPSFGSTQTEVITY